ncbi:hypothetical protein H9657_05115 [Cellulomonas sp. Sa3CUA2]|uniref:Integral membrane protein n=1 Tax=Cellulomonas avistercoris TaxID=2762242 RepID=A0ABR8QB74_9CELL|nr:hypothetical protein [Cellulomonas avistercoris]MBD7917661.1 hypothetical protein [Cellulomonas avistercoris]
MTAPEPLPVTSTGTRLGSPGPRVVGPRAVLEVCGRAALILLAAAAVLYVGYVVVERPAPGDAVDAGTAAAILALMYALHLVALLVLGWPGGIATAHLLRHETSEARHVAGFAVTGAVLGAAVLLVVGHVGAAAVWAVVGAASAGAARAWTGHARRRRAVHPSRA